MAEDTEKAKNQQLIEEVELFKKDMQELRNLIEEKLNNNSRKQKMEKRREEVFEEIDKYYDMMKTRLDQRREQVKQEYRSIENREKRRLDKIAIKLNKTSDELKEVEEQFDMYTQEFDIDNKAGFDVIRDQFEEVLANHYK